MGTTLTGTTPQDTYDSLIKVTDNGPISATAKYLSDGLGNDSALALSTTAVGIGTTSIFADLQVNKASDVTIAMSNSTAVTSGNRGSISFYNSAVSTVAVIRAAAVTDNVGTELQFHTRPAAGAVTQQMTITSAGNVGIGTSAPARTLSVAGIGKFTRTLTLGANDGTTSFGLYITNEAFANNADTTVATIGTAAASNIPIIFAPNATERLRVTDNGLTFNGDTAAANALDDYEEGTWTMGVSFGGASVAVTALFNSGTYTKIGRQVTVNGLLQLTSKGSSSGTAKITGLPFTIGTATANYSATAIRFKNIAFTNQFQGISDINTTTVLLEEITILGAVTNLSDADFANNSEVIISLTYFV